MKVASSQITFTASHSLHKTTTEQEKFSFWHDSAVSPLKRQVVLSDFIKVDLSKEVRPFDFTKKGMPGPAKGDIEVNMFSKWLSTYYAYPLNNNPA